MPEGLNSQRSTGLAEDYDIKISVGNWATNKVYLGEKSSIFKLELRWMFFNKSLLCQDNL